MKIKFEENWVYPEKALPLFYFKGNRENCKELMEKLCRNTGAENTCDFAGDASDHVYFECNGIVETIKAEVLEYLKRFGLETKEIKVQEYRRFGNIFTLTAADALNTPIYLKRKGKYHKCRIMDTCFRTPEGDKKIVVKVEKDNGYEIVYVSADLEKAELYY